MNNFIEYDNRLVFSPGYYLKDCIDEGYISLSELGDLLHLSDDNLELLLGGKLCLTNIMADKLACYLGFPNQLWLDIESNWRKVVK